MSDERRTDTRRVKVRVMLTFGDRAELVTPWHPVNDPLRMPAEVIARDARLPVGELPGRRFTAVGDRHALRDFELVDDPRR